MTQQGRKESHDCDEGSHAGRSEGRAPSGPGVRGGGDPRGAGHTVAVRAGQARGGAAGGATCQGAVPVLHARTGGAWKFRRAPGEGLSEGSGGTESFRGTPWGGVKSGVHLPRCMASPPVVPQLEDLGRRGRALLVLAHMARKDESVTMTEFTHASRLVPEVARMLREDLECWGLVHSEVVGRRGVVELLSIRLTPLGREVAVHVLALEDRLRLEARRVRDLAAPTRA